MEMERNQVKITYNPYKKQLAYQFRNGASEWEDVSSQSPLSEERFRNATLQNRAIEIVKTISDAYNNGTNGLDIIFEGTAEDFNDFNEIVQCYFDGENIKCIQDDNILISAENALQEICEIFDDLDETFKEYPDSDLQKELNRFRDTVKTTISICVMGLYSAGKSAFINALIGEEILPSASDPLTAKTYRIASEEQASIRFQYNGENVVLLFSGVQYIPKAPSHLLSSPLFTQLREAVESSKCNTQAMHIYQALKVINSYERNQNTPNIISDVIDVQVPFSNSDLSLDAFRFVIYDTPGSNSASNQRHMDILQEALKGQTNGLPIFLTTPDTMDSKDNNEIISIIDKMANALDRTNTMVIVNRSDEKDADTLKSKKQSCANLRISQWKSSRIFFVSSIMGLASKKENPEQKESWSDLQYFKVYRQQVNSFTDPDDDFYLPLYEYNLLPQDRYDSICSKGAAAGSHDMLRHTSGIWGVEDEINRFANKYAVYNKCSQAQEYLQNAIQLADEKRKECEQQQAQLEQKLASKISKKEECLQKELDDKSNELDDNLFTKYTTLMSQTGMRQVDGINGTCPDEIKKKWNELKKSEKDSKKRNADMKNWLKKFFTNSISPVIQHIIEESKNLLENAEKQYKEGYKKVIWENTLLSQEERAILDQYIMECPSVEVKNIIFNPNVSFRTTRFLFWQTGEKFEQKSCIRGFQEQASDTIIDWIDKIKMKHKGAFQNWSDNFTQSIKNRLRELNPELTKLTAEQEVCQNELNMLHNQGIALQNSEEELMDIFEICNE